MRAFSITNITIDLQTYRQTDRHTDRHRQTDTDRQTDRHRQTDTDRQTETDKDIYREKLKHITPIKF